MRIEDWNIIECEDNLQTVECYAKIRNNLTGEIRICNTKEHFFHKEDEFPSVFNWEENNYSCDCNRYIFWLRANNEYNDQETKCSDGKFSVNLYNSKNNECYYKEFEE